MRKLVFDAALTADGWLDAAAVTVGADGTIAAVGPAAGESGIRIAGVALPGLANVHSHAFQRGMAGLAERSGDSDDSFWTWREVMYRFLERLTPEDVEAIAALAYAEMLEAGFTRVGEFHYLHRDPKGHAYADIAEMAHRVASAARATGIGLTLLPVFYAHGNFAGAPPAPGQRRFLGDPDGFARLLEESRRAIADDAHANLGIAPHSLRAVSLDELRHLVANAPEGPIHIHVAEQTKEVDDCLAAHGRRPAELLFDSVEPDGRWCFIHATHTTDDERREMARRGVTAGLCPITESNLGDGIFGARRFLDGGGRFGVGTDSNVLISVAGELRTLEYSQRLAHRARNVLAPRGASTGRALFDGALAGGAKALGLEAAGIRPGARADFVVLDRDHPAFAERRGDAILDSFVFAGGDRAIGEVWAGGRRVVEAGRHVAREAIETRYRAALARILA